jgi:uncharacterized protein (TIGR00106 family)
MGYIHAEFSIVPIGTGSTSLSRYIKAAVNALKAKGLRCEVTGMCTLIECNSIDELFDALKAAKDAVLALGVKRVELSIRIDERLDKVKSLDEKAKSVSV